MAEEFRYRDYIIRATPSRLTDGGWTHDGVVSHSLGQLVDQRKFSAPGKSETRAAAVTATLSYGVEMINKGLV